MPNEFDTIPVPDALDLTEHPPLRGVTTDTSRSGVEGVHFEGGAGMHGRSRHGDGIVGDGAHNGVVGRSRAGNHSGVWADNVGGGFGVAGTSDAPGGVGVFGRGARLAGRFEGDVEITGNLTIQGVSIQLLLERIQQLDLPETVTLDSGSITSDLSIGGFAKLVMTRGGQFTFSGHMHNSGALGIDFLLTLVAMTPSGIAYTVQHPGHTAGSLTSGSRDDDWTISGFNEGIRDNWAEASQAKLTWTMHANDTLTPQLGKALEEALKEALKDLGKAAVKALIALL